MLRVRRISSFFTNHACRFSTEVAEKESKKAPGKIKRLALFFYNPIKMALIDYKDVFVETGKKMAKKPIKSALSLSLLGGVGFCWYNNPSLDHYRDTALSNHHKLLMLSWRIRNKTSDNFVDSVRILDREGLLAHRSFLVFSVIYRAHVNSELREFGATYLSPRWAEYLDRIVDVGWMGRWYYMEEAMMDYDINEDEWK